MRTLTTYGEMNGHMLGILMKSLAQRALVFIRDCWTGRVDVEVFDKESYNPDKPMDLFTTADTGAQQIYLKSLRECTPTFGIIAEEDALQVGCCHPDKDIYWTLDPMDGTRAFSREQSHGIGTMLALVCNTRVIAVVIGDATTQELFYYRPDSPKVHRVFDFSSPRELHIDKTKSLEDQYLLLRDPPYKYSSLVQVIASNGEEFDLFKSYQIDGGSIGTMMARLWKGEVGAVVLEAGIETPWDFTPVLGISQKLGFVFLAATGKDGKYSWSNPLEITPPKEIRERNYDLLIIHESRLEEFRNWLNE